MTQGPACSTVTGRTSPLSSNSCVMPIFFPIMPLTAIIFSRLIMPAVRGHCRLSLLRRFMRLVERLDLHIHAGRQIELHERVYRLLRRLQDIDQALVRADLESLARFLVYVRRPQHAILVLHRGQRNGPRHLGAGAARRLHDLAGGLVEHAVIVGLQPDANSLSYHISSLKELAVRSPRLNCVSFDYCSFFMSGELPESCQSFHRSCSDCSPAALPFRRVLSCASTTRVQRSMSWSIYICLGQNLADGAGAHGAAAFADGEAQAFLHGHRGDQLDGQSYVVARHHHLGRCRQLRYSGDVGCPEVELRPVTLEEWGMSAAFFFG